MKAIKNKLWLFLSALILITVTFFSTYSMNSASASLLAQTSFYKFYQIDQLPEHLVVLDNSYSGVSIDGITIHYEKDSTGIAEIFFADYSFRISNDYVAVYKWAEDSDCEHSFVDGICEHCGESEKKHMTSAKVENDGFGYFRVFNEFGAYYKLNQNPKDLIFDRIETSGNIQLYVDRTVGHTFEYVEEVAPTCQSSGVDAHYYCSHCDKTYDLEYFESTDFEIPMLSSHVYTWIDEIPATVNSVGVKGHYVCQHCNLTVDENYELITDLTIPMLEEITIITNDNNLGKIIAISAGIHLLATAISLIILKTIKKKK